MKYVCSKCEEGCFDPCVLILDVFYSKPTLCPLDGDDADWQLEEK
jgi:hypothetical protein